MQLIESRNVNSAYQKGLRLLLSRGVDEKTRAGDAIAIPGPVMNVYKSPSERVLFDPYRDANPFFHIVEAVWMLAGWNDARILDRFVGDFSSRFAEDDGLAHGAYGRRWRKHFTSPAYTGHEDSHAPYYLDQLTEAGRLLRNNPESRQVVIAMWDPSEDLGANKRDIPCNDLIMFRSSKDWKSPVGRSLDMTIVARSHDAVWGAYGANIVHMSVMHEVVSALAGMPMGTYYHLSNNFHVYRSILPRLGEFLPQEETERDPYESTAVAPQAIATNRSEAEVLLDESSLFCEQLRGELTVPTTGFTNQWLKRTVVPMVFAHVCYKQGDFRGALRAIEEVFSSDWRLAGRLWLERRQERMKAKGLV